MRKITALILALAFAISVQASEWELDGTHSSVQFVVSHMTISKVRGEFTQFDGKLNFDGQNAKDGSVTFTVKTASVSTGNTNRDGHLRSDDFFDSDHFADIKFVSKQVVPGDGNKFKLIGDLTIRDSTKVVSFDCEFNGVITGRGGRVAGFSAETTINRQDFNVKFNRAMEAGGLVVGNEVKLSLELEFGEIVQEKPAEGK
ncbi:MAG TPA: YceI family protein [candidate division Zixibacteria bacterium]|nr:YceI family protein [candidate division Zixibacteria bacterium]